MPLVMRLEVGGLQEIDVGSDSSLTLSDMGYPTKLLNIPAPSSVLASRAACEVAPDQFGWDHPLPE
jgi:hypothetical protein